MRARLASAYERLGEEVQESRCCDTNFRMQATGLRVSHAVAAARRTAKTLKEQLDAFVLVRTRTRTTGMSRVVTGLPEDRDRPPSRVVAGASSTRC